MNDLQKQLAVWILENPEASKRLMLSIGFTALFCGNEWSKPERFYFGGIDNLQLPSDLEDVPHGTLIEIQWRVVEADNAPAE